MLEQLVTPHGSVKTKGSHGFIPIVTLACTLKPGFGALAVTSLDLITYLLEQTWVSFVGMNRMPDGNTCPLR